MTSKKKRRKIENNLIGVKAPEFELFLEERTADVGRVVQFAGAVVIEDLGKDSWVAVEEVFVENGIVVGQGFRQPRQSRGRDLFERCAVRLETETAHVQNDAIFAVHLSPASPARATAPLISSPGAIVGHTLIRRTTHRNNNCENAIK